MYLYNCGEMCSNLLTKFDCMHYVHVEYYMCIFLRVYVGYPQQENNPNNNCRTDNPHANNTIYGSCCWLTMEAGGCVDTDYRCSWFILNHWTRTTSICDPSGQWRWRQRRRCCPRSWSPTSRHLAADWANAIADGSESSSNVEAACAAVTLSRSSHAAGGRA